MRAIFPQIVGNDRLKERLAPKLCAGSLVHALILEGAVGSGKKTLALQIAMAAACQHRASPTHPLPCGECPSCRRIVEGLSPDVIRIQHSPDKVTIGIEQVRTLREEVRALPNDLDVKVYIIEGADTMTMQAQNALLLTLEEPPPFVLFLLLTTDASALLETIRSRAPIFRMQPVCDEEMRAFLEKKATGGARWLMDNGENTQAILRIANGSIGRALTLLDRAVGEPQILARERAKRTCELLASTGASAELLLLFLSFPTSRDDLSAQLATIKEALRDLILLSQSEHAPLIFFTDREAATDLALRFPTGRLFRYSELTEAALSALAMNANVRLTLIGLFDGLIAL